MSLRVVVVGGGTMGLASAWALARRGATVQVLERVGHVHDLGSHSGYTRIIRQAYHEGSDYVRVVLAADRAWTALEARQGERLLVRCGLLELGPPDDPEFQAARRALEAHEIEHRSCDAAEAMRTWPLQIPSSWTACFTPQSGYLRVAPCLDALRDEAAAAGARFAYGVAVREVEPGGPGPRVSLVDGTVVEADRVVVAAGAYSAAVVPGFFAAGGPCLRALRRVLAWTEPAPLRRAALAAMPTWAVFAPEGFFYGFPWNEEGIAGFKLACHTARAMPWMDEPVDPEHVRRDVDRRDLDPLLDFLGRYVPAGAGRIVATRVCLYGATPRWDFLIDLHPADPRICVASGFSGHGFKFAPEIGELVADLVERGESDRGLAIFARKSHAP